MRIHAVILAGGQGRRMGADKALVHLAGRTLLAHVLDRLTPQVGAIALSANGDPARFAGYGLPVLPDEQALGPLSGLASALAWAEGHPVLTVPVDAPFLPADLALRLADGPLPALARAGGRIHGATGVWPATALAPLRAFLASGAKPKVTDFAGLLGAGLVDFPDAGAFQNLNTPEDLALAEARLAS